MTTTTTRRLVNEQCRDEALAAAARGEHVQAARWYRSAASRTIGHNKADRYDALAAEQFGLAGMDPRTFEFARDEEAVVHASPDTLKLTVAGGRHGIFPLATPEPGPDAWREASAIFSARREASCEGASTFGDGFIRHRGATVARLSYNGKVWPPGEPQPGMAPLFDPYAQGGSK